MDVALCLKRVDKVPVVVRAVFHTYEYRSLLDVEVRASEVALPTRLSRRTPTAVRSNRRHKSGKLKLLRWFNFPRYFAFRASLGRFRKHVLKNKTDSCSPSNAETNTDDFDQYCKGQTSI